MELGLCTSDIGILFHVPKQYDIFEEFCPYSRLRLTNPAGIPRDSILFQSRNPAGLVMQDPRD